MVSPGTQGMLKQAMRSPAAGCMKRKTSGKGGEGNMTTKAQHDLAA